MTSYPAPPDATAHRLTWPFLPRRLRDWVEAKCGSLVVAWESRDAGFTPGFASVLTCADGSRHFVKAASTKAQRSVADSYREEGTRLARIPTSVPAPALKWFLDDDWVALGIEHVAGRSPSRPWRPEDLDATLDALEVVAADLTPAPPDLPLHPLSADLAPLAQSWDRLAADRPELPHLADSAALAARFAEICEGTTVVHTDVRADNVLLDPDGRARICDWAWPALGPAWTDSAMVLVGARGDGVDVTGRLASRPLLRDLPGEHLDILLALLAGHFTWQGTQPVPHTSPWVRAHQAWHGEVCRQWLAERRGWH